MCPKKWYTANYPLLVDLRHARFAVCPWHTGNKWNPVVHTPKTLQSVTRERKMIIASD